MKNPMDNRLMHYAFPRDQIQLDGTMANLPDKIAAAVEDTTDAVIVQAILAAARAEGVTDLYLLDKKFITEAIREKREREHPATNADRIRAMSDENLAAALLDIYDGTNKRVPYCCYLPECTEDLNSDRDIPEERCIGCMLEWLRQPAKEDDHGS